MHTPETEGDPNAVDTRTRVRTSDMATSHAAAETLTNGKLRDSQRFIYELLSDNGPMTDDQIRHEVIAREGKASKSGPATRRLELWRAGWVRPATDTEGKRIKGTSDAGNPMTVWAAVPEEEWRPPEFPATPTDESPTETPSGEGSPAAHDDEAGRAAARRYGQWHFGDESIAERIVWAYLNPAEAEARLDEEMSE